MGSTSRCYSVYTSLSDEAELLPCRLVYLSGCNLRCRYCVQAPAGLDPRHGVPLEIPRLSAALAASQASGVRSVQLVGGEPTVHLPSCLRLAASLRERCPELPLVLKSNYCMAAQTRELLDGAIDVHLADLKFGPGPCAERIAGVRGYWDQVRSNLLWAAGQGRLIVRHLLLPGHLRCCAEPVVAWARDALPQATLRLMEGFVPAWEADSVGLGRCPTRAELQAAAALFAAAPPLSSEGSQ